MRKTWGGLHVIHDMTSFRHIRGLHGVEHYADRAMLLPADTVYVQKDASGLVEEHLAFLRTPDVALGPSNLKQVDGEDIFGGIMSDPFVLEDIRKATMRGAQVQVFCMTKRAEAFFAEALIDRHRIGSAPLEIAAKLNDKVELRRMGEAMGLRHAFLDHVVAENPAKAVSAVRTFLSRPPEEVPFAVVKQPDLAGGDGFLKIMRGDDLESVMHPYFERYGQGRVIVEEGHPHKALSIMITVGRQKSFRVMGWTRQLVHADLGQHFGNSMVRMAPGREHPLIDAEQRRSMETWGLMFAKYAHERIVGYHGTIGFDLIMLKRPRKDGRDLFMLECNARQTASVYPLAVSHQLEGRGAEEWGITMWNALPTAARSYGEVLKRLGNDLVFSRARGVIPFNPRLLGFDEPAIGLTVVGKDLIDAGRMGREARRRLLD